MMNFSFEAVNPWEDDSTAISSIRSSLILAEQMGLKPLTAESDSKCAQTLAQLSSTKTMYVQKDITDKNKTLHKIKQNIGSRKQERDVSQFLNHEAVERNISMTNQLCTDFDCVLKNTHVLIHRLQKPFVGDHIKMDAAYHRFAKEVFSQLVPTLNDLTVHLDSITWAASQDFSSSQLEPLLVEIQSLTASMQTSCHMLSQVTNGVEMMSCGRRHSAALEISEDSIQSLDSNIALQHRNIRGTGARAL